MAGPDKREYHPALLLYVITFLLLLFTIVCGVIALFVPWVQKDIAPGLRVWAALFKTCFVQTFSPVNAYTCEDNDFIVGPQGAPLTGGNPTCKALAIVAIAMGLCGILSAIVIEFPLVFMIIKLWYRPIKLAIFLQIWIILVPMCCACCWGLFIGYAENLCAPNSIFPVHGYSYGFILFLFSTALSTAASVTGFMGLKKLRRYQLPQLYEQEKAMYPTPYEVFYDYPPQVIAPAPLYAVASPRTLPMLDASGMQAPYY